MAPTSLTIKLSSCKNLKSFNFFQKLCVYSTISIINQDPITHRTTQRYQEQKTPVDRDGDSNPEWNHQAQFDLTKLSSTNMDHLFIEFDLFCEGLVFGIGNKSIGHVRVPIKELLEESKGGVVRFGSYQVMSSEEKPDSGVLDFSYKVVDDNPNPTSNLYPWQGYPQPQEVIYPSPPPPEVYYTSPPQTPHYPPPQTEMFYTSPSQTPHYPQPPPPEVFYASPPQTPHYHQPPPPEVFYTSPPQTPHYLPPPTPEVYYTSPPQTPHYPPPQQVYYPPMPAGVAYPGSVTPYYGEQLEPHHGDAWHNGRGAELGVGFGPWGVR